LQIKPRTTTSTFFFFLSNYFPPPYLPPLEEAATDAFSWSWHVVSSCRCCMEVSRRRGLTTPGPALWPLSLSLSLIRRMAGAAYWHGAAVSRGWVRSAANACEEKQHQLVVASSSSAQHAPRKTSTRADARSPVLSRALYGQPVRIGGREKSPHLTVAQSYTPFVSSKSNGNNT
jgi:hypothetical protein